MKFIRKSTMLILAMGMLLFACNPDNVAPTENGNGNPSLAGAVGDPHPVLDTICQTADTMFLVREDNGSEFIDKCYGPAGPRPCNTTESAMRWGYLNMLEGYLNDTGYIDCNFTMAPGWFCDQNNWEFSIASAFQFDQNGIPLVTNDWSANIVAPAANRWQLRIATTVLPDPCYAVALRVGAIKLNLFGAVVAGSQTTLWGRNRNWNVTGHPANSPSPWLQSLCPLRCLDGPEEPPMDTTRICEVVYTGLTCTGNTLNSTVLHPTTSETGVITYAWSNGATTQDLTVSPTVTTDYTVVISVDGVPTHVVIFTVNVIDVSCTITQGGGGNGGGGNGGGNGGSGGSGSGNGGSGSGNGSGGSGSHHPGCNHNHNNNSNCNGGNHQHGCNAQHSGNNNNCNNRGHGRGCSGSHANNRSCNGGHTRGCRGTHSTNQTCQTNSGHRNNCTGQHNGNTCNTGLQHAQGCNGNHHAYRGCNTNNNGNGGSGSGSGSGHGGSGSGSGNGGNCGNGGGGNGGGGNTTTIPGVKVCHVPPGNPGGATTVCVPYSQLAQHVTGVCPTNNGGGGNSGGGGNGGSGSGNGSGSGSGSGNGSGHGWGGSGSGNGGSGSGSGGGNGHGCGGHTNNCNGHHQGGNCNNGHSGSGSGGSGSGHGSGQGSGSGGHGSGSNAHGHGSNHGGGCQGNQGGGHPGDMIGACNSNPCL